jgi:hypothetical protein
MNKVFISSLLSITALSAVSSVWADDASHVAIPSISDTYSCIPNDQAQDYINELGIQMDQFGGVELCDNTKRGKQVLDAIWSIESGQFADATGNSSVLEPGLLGVGYYDYLKSHITEIVANGCGSGQFIMACVFLGTTTMHIQDYLFTGNFPSVMQVATLIHEARHTEGFSHVDCEAGPLASISGGCDQNLAYRGAYAVELEYLAKVTMQGQNFNPVFQTLARQSAISVMEENLNEMPDTGVDELIMIDGKDGHIALFDGQNITDRTQINATGDLLIPRLYGTMLVPTDRTKTASFLDAYLPALNADLNVSTMIGSTMVTYNGETADQRATLLDISNRTDYQARLYPDHLEFTVYPTGTATDDKVVSLPLNGVSSIHFVDSTFCSPAATDSTTPSQVYIRGSDNTVYQVNGIANLAPTLQATACTIPADLALVTHFQGKFLAQKNDGSIVSVDTSGSESTFAPLSGRTASQITTTSIYRSLQQ